MKNFLHFTAQALAYKYPRRAKIPLNRRKCMLSIGIDICRHKISWTNIARMWFCCLRSYSHINKNTMLSFQTKKLPCALWNMIWIYLTPTASPFDNSINNTWPFSGILFGIACVLKRSFCIPSLWEVIMVCKYGASFILLLKVPLMALMYHHVSMNNA